MGSGSISVSDNAPSSASERLQSPASSAVEATIIGELDVGFGNSLFIRGDGAGLNWDTGVLLECLDSQTWVWKTSAAERPFHFKFLLNDQVWCQGDDFQACPGQTIRVSPVF